MANSLLYINQGALDSTENIWCVGRDLTVYDGQSWIYYNGSNSIVPDNSPYYLDTRSISIDSNDTKWVGCAVSSGLSQDLIFFAAGPEAATGSAWAITDFDLAGPNWEVPTIAAYNQWHQACLQHLAFLQQTQRQSPTVGDHNPWRAEASLEAYLHQQQALVAVQALERERLQKSPPRLGRERRRPCQPAT